MHKWNIWDHEMCRSPRVKFSSVRVYLLRRLRARKILFGGNPRTETPEPSREGLQDQLARCDCEAADKMGIHACRERGRETQTSECPDAKIHKTAGSLRLRDRREKESTASRARERDEGDGDKGGSGEHCTQEGTAIPAEVHGLNRRPHYRRVNGMNTMPGP